MKRKLAVLASMVMCLSSVPITSSAEFTVKPDIKTVKGDINSDKEFGISDVVTLQRWILGVPDMILPDWKNADYNNDGILDVFDFCAMKNNLIYKSSESSDIKEEHISKIPDLAAISEMSNEEALNALKGLTWEELLDFWGKPYESYDYICGSCWKCGDKQITVEFIPNEYCEVENVTIEDSSSEQEIQDERFKSIVTSIVNTAQFIDDVKERISQIEQNERINSIVVLEDENEITSGKLRSEKERTVIVYYDDNQKLEFNIPVKKYFSEFIVLNDDAKNLPDGCSIGFSLEEYQTGGYCYNNHVDIGAGTVIDSGFIDKLALVDLNGDNKREIVAITENNETKQLVIYDYSNDSLYKYNSDVTDYQFKIEDKSVLLFNSITYETIKITLGDEIQAAVSNPEK